MFILLSDNTVFETTAVNFNADATVTFDANDDTHTIPADRILSLSNIVPGEANLDEADNQQQAFERHEGLEAEMANQDVNSELH